MDEFVLQSQQGQGTTVTMRKWRSTRATGEDEERDDGGRGRGRAHRAAVPRGRRRLARRQAAAAELVAHLREHRTQLRQEWVERIDQSRLLTAMTPQEVHSETTSVYDNYVEVLETGSVEALRSYARDLSERIIPRGVETHEVVGIVLLLRDVLARSLFQKYADDLTLLDHVLDAYEPAANRIANTVAVSFVDERERVIRQQQDAIRELSTPVLQVRERLLILPIIGVLDAERARSSPSSCSPGIRTHRAKVVVIDTTGCRTSTSRWRTTSCRRSTRHASWVRASSSPGSRRRSRRRW
jgi:hypothetical protein